VVSHLDPRGYILLKKPLNQNLLYVEVEVNLRPTVSRPVCLGVRRPSGTCNQFFFLLGIFFRQLRVCYFVAPSLTRGRVCNLLYSCFWVLPEQSLLDRSPAELTAIFYCLIWDSTNLEGQVPIFRSHICAVRNFQYYHWEGCMGSMQCNVEFGVGLLLVADSQTTSSSGYWASLWDPWPDFILLFFLRLTVTLFFFRRRLLRRENRSVVYSAITH
jgi:hypothetical protein